MSRESDKRSMEDSAVQDPQDLQNYQDPQDPQDYWNPQDPQDPQPQDRAPKAKAHKESPEEKFARLDTLEEEFHANGYGLLAGVDEAGRGPLAGPVYVGACILDPARPIYGLDDSKKLTPKKRAALYEEIKEKAYAWSVVALPPERIDEINILNAVKEGGAKAIADLKAQGKTPDLVLCDALTLAIDLPQRSLIHGDARANCIAAASILAKVSRDEEMVAMDAVYPQYGFAKHKGYGTKAHREALLAHGPCPIHRLSFLSKIFPNNPDYQLPKDPARQEAQQLGRAAEDLVCRNLEGHGYKIEKRNWLVPGLGEADIIASKGGKYVLIEVKARVDDLEHDQAFASLGALKIRRLRGLADYFWQGLPQYKTQNLPHAVTSEQPDSTPSMGLWLAALSLQEVNKGCKSPKSFLLKNMIWVELFP